MSFRVASVDDSWLTNGLVAYYPFDGDFKDYSGNGNDATNHGALINSNGVAFNGTNSYLSYPVFGLTGARTYSAWVSSEGGIAILSQMKPFPASPHERWSFYATGNGLGLYYQLGYGGQYANGTYNKWFQQCLVDLHALNQCVAVLNPNDNNEEKVSLYLNGVYIGSVGDFIFSEMPTQYESGRELNSDIDIGYSSGIMKKLRIYNRALSSKEVAQLYALESTPPASFGPTNSQSISFPAIPTLTLTNGAYTLGATASSGLLVSYAIGDSTVAGITNGALIPLGVGTTTVVASQAGDTNYLPATPVTNTLVVTLAQQTVTPTSVATRTYGSLPFGLTLPTNASGLAITPRIVSGPATLSGMNIIITGTGTVSLAYDAPGNALYAPASVTNTFSVTNGPTNLKSQNITFKALAAKAYGSAPQALAGSASSKLPVTYWSSNTNVAVINGTNVVITGAGSTVITAYQPGDGASYNPATPVSQTLLVNQAAQKLTLKAPKSVAYGSTPATITATSSAGLPVTVTSSDTSIATITNSGTNALLVPTGVGTITLTASQPGNANVGAAIPLGQVVVITPGVQTITFGALAPNTYGTAPITLTATSSAGLPVTFTSSATNVASISGNRLTISGAGSAKITATQSGSKLWSPTAISQQLIVAKASQTIHFTPPSTVRFTNGGLVTLGATASSGLPVAYKSGNIKVLSITGSTCVITGRGTTTVVASQAGGGNYLPAPSVTNTITVQ